MSDIEKEAQKILDSRKINLGDTVRDTVTGYTGIATAKSEALGELPQIQVEKPGLTEDGDLCPEIWFAEARLEKISQ